MQEFTGLDWFDYFHTWAQLVCYAIAAVLAERCARKNGGNLILRLLAGAFLCYTLGNMFQNLYTTIFGVYPYKFSVADLSWLGVYVCQIVICLHIMGEFTQEERRVLRRSRLAALAIAAAAVFPAHAYMVYLYGQLLNNLCYAAALFGTAYLTLQLLFASRDGARPGMRGYYAVTLISVVQVVLMFLTSCLDYPVYYLYYVFTVMQSFMPFVLLWQLNQGIRRVKGEKAG